MKTELPAPYDRLIWFQERLGLNGRAAIPLKKHRTLFLNKKEDFSAAFFNYFKEIPETRHIIENPELGKRLKKVWTEWFQNLFIGIPDRELLGRLWKSGLKHVQLNIDQRFVNLGYSYIRGFCQDIARTGILDDEREAVMIYIDKLIDLCLLIETQAYIAGTAQCDMEVIKGLSHQVRNPLTIIGGNILRLRKKLGEESPVTGVYDAILF